MRTENYILDESGQPVVEPDLTRWSQWFGVPDNRRVANDDVGPYHVSTVFLGIDHNWSESGPPVLWETMIFGTPKRDEEVYCERYATRDEALRGHARAVQIAVERLRSEGGLS